MALAIGRSLQTLSLILESGREMTLAELESATGVGRLSLRRLLSDLTDEGWIVHRERPHRYAATSRVLEVAASYLQWNHPRSVVLPYAIDLARSIGHQTAVAFYEEGISLATDAVQYFGGRTRPVLYAHRRPALASSSGRIFLTYLPESEVETVIRAGVPQFTEFTTTSPEALRIELEATRARGYGLADRQTDPDLSGISTVVLDSSERPVAALAITLQGPLTEELVASLLPPLQAATLQASFELGYRARAGRWPAPA